jgi:hypothetical protein
MIRGDPPTLPGRQAGGRGRPAYCQADTNHGLEVRDFPYHKNVWSDPSLIGGQAFGTLQTAGNRHARKSFDQ